MESFSLPVAVKFAASFQEFAQDAGLCETDLILTNKFIYDPFIKPCRVDCKVLFQERYGSGEPNDCMVDHIRRDIPDSVKRIIAVGGGTVIDIAKILTLTGDWRTEDIFTDRIVPEKGRGLTVIPTTCGTGSEVTNVTICELRGLGTKKGFALDTLYADSAVLIPEILHTLPYRFFATSSIDALIHAVESFVSPKAIPHSEAYSEKAIRMIVNGYRYMKENGRESWTDKAEDFLNASNLAGIAFGYAGCAAVHALSYPLGGTYHIPHGEANQIMFAGVFQKYIEIQPKGKINKLEEILAELLNSASNDALPRLYELMDIILEKKKLREYGIKEEELSGFADSVIEGQARLLRNNYTALTKSDITDIYRSCY